MKMSFRSCPSLVPSKLQYIYIYIYIYKYIYIYICFVLKRIKSHTYIAYVKYNPSYPITL